MKQEFPRQPCLTPFPSSSACTWTLKSIKLILKVRTQRWRGPCIANALWNAWSDSFWQTFKSDRFLITFQNWKNPNCVRVQISQFKLQRAGKRFAVFHDCPSITIMFQVSLSHQSFSVCVNSSYSYLSRRLKSPWYLWCLFMTSTSLSKFAVWRS